MSTPLRPSALVQPLARLRRYTLGRLEAQLAAVLGPLDGLSVTGGRPYSARCTFWCFLWQTLQPAASCRQAVRQLQATLSLAHQPDIDEGTSAYCQARARLPLAPRQAALATSAANVAGRTDPSASLQGRPVRMLDGTMLALPDTAANQAQYPQSKSQQPGCGWPALKLLVAWDNQGAAITDLATGNQHDSELGLGQQLFPRLPRNAIVVYDRALGHYVGCALAAHHQRDLISRVHVRQIDWRKGTRLGPGERLVQWRKSRQPSPTMSPAQWAQLPAEIVVRVIRVPVRQKGFRARTLTLVTTLLDPKLYPAAEIAAAYLRRWRLEMCLDDLKTVLGLEALRCLSPAMIDRELRLRLIAHNLVRAIMAEAAHTHDVPLERISFTGTLHTLQCFGPAAQFAGPGLARRLWRQMLRLLAADQLPLRPDRWEPRAVKRRPKPYPPLTRPRHLYRQKRHGGFYRRPSSI